MINYNLNERTIKNKPIPKVNFYNHTDFLKANEKIFVSDIKNIILLYSIDSETTGINSYKDENNEYSVINIFQINLKNKKNVNKITKILFTLILEPCLLEFVFENEICFAITNFRINKNNESKNIIENIHITQFLDIKDDWLNNFDLNKFNWSNANLYSLHQNLIEKIVFKILSDVGINLFTSIEDGLKKLTKLKNLQGKLNKLDLKIKSTQQFNKKCDLIDEKNKLKNIINNSLKN